MDEAAQYVATRKRPCPGVSMYGLLPGKLGRPPVLRRGGADARTSGEIAHSPLELGLDAVTPAACGRRVMRLVKDQETPPCACPQRHEDGQHEGTSVATRHPVSPSARSRRPPIVANTAHGTRRSPRSTLPPPSRARTVPPGPLAKDVRGESSSGPRPPWTCHAARFLSTLCGTRGSPRPVPPPLPPARTRRPPER